MRRYIDCRRWLWHWRWDLRWWRVAVLPRLRQPRRNRRANRRLRGSRNLRCQLRLLPLRPLSDIPQLPHLHPLRLPPLRRRLLRPLSDIPQLPCLPPPPRRQVKCNCTRFRVGAGKPHSHSRHKDTVAVSLGRLPLWIMSARRLCTHQRIGFQHSA